MNDANNDLRISLAKAAARGRDKWALSDRVASAEDYIAVEIEKVLSDPVRRLAILNLIGDVREGVLTEHPLGWFVATGDAAADGTVPVLVVVPSGEATDE